MPAFSESQQNAANQANDGCLPLYTSSSAANNRPQYVKTTARGGQVFRLLAVFEDGKQDHHALSSGSGGGNGGNGKQSTVHGREKEKGRYAQLLNENRQVLYVSLSTKGKFYEIEPGIPQILQKLGGTSPGSNKKINTDCVHRITMLVTLNKQLPLTIRYITGSSSCNNIIPEYVCITKISTENVIIACPIEDVEAQTQLHLRKLHLTKEMNVLKSSLGFESEQRMLANPNVQNILKFCQFNCDQFLKMVEVELHNRAERSGSKSRVDGLRILKPLHLPKLLRREKTTMSAAHEREDSIIFFSKTDLANMGAKEALPKHTNATNDGPNRITDKMKVFQSTKKKWFRKQDKNATLSLTSLEMDVQAKRMSMERYSDISKLLQERFSDKPNANHMVGNEHGSVSGASITSDIGCSDTETSILPTVEEQVKHFPQRSKGNKEAKLQKSMSLQDIELMTGGANVARLKASRKPDLLSHQRTDTISEAGTDLEEHENCTPLPQSFITEKLYNEFHVKTRQYSKSSSSLHQLLNFSLPQKLHVNDNHKRALLQGKNSAPLTNNTGEKRFDFNIGAPVAGRRITNGGRSSVLAENRNSAPITPLTPISLIEDDLPYSSVRDSLVLSSDDSPTDNPIGNICQALNLIDYTKENIYAEICHDANALGGLPNSRTRDTCSAYTHSTDLCDDYGDYASLTYPAGSAPAGHVLSTAGNAVSRVQINCLPSTVSYHTVYLGDEPLGVSGDRSHVTTVELKGISSTNGKNDAAVAKRTDGGSVVDNIYNTLK